MQCDGQGASALDMLVKVCWQLMLTSSSLMAALICWRNALVSCSLENPNSVITNDTGTVGRYLQNNIASNTIVVTLLHKH